MYQSKKTRTFSKFLSIFLSLLMVIPFFAMNVSAAAYNVGDIVEYGSYPKTLVTDSVLIKQLAAIGGNYYSYAYFTGSGHSDDGKMAANDFMQYTDVTLEGQRYRGVIFTGYRPMSTGGIVINWGTNSRQDENGYTYGQTYWFRYEPLRWKILNPSTGLVLCDTIIDSQPYHNFLVFATNDYYGNSEKTLYANNYYYSSIRTWLNNEFINTAFDGKQIQNILTTHLTTPGILGNDSAYTSPESDDRIFLLSYEDVLNTAYQFSAKTDSAVVRIAEATDYAKCQGVFVDSKTAKSYWRLRSAGSNQYSVCYVDTNGAVQTYSTTNYTANGIRPAMCITLNEAVLTTCMHTYEVTVIEPDCVDQGYTEYTCTICGNAYRECFVPALGHIDKIGKIVEGTEDDEEPEQEPDNRCDRCGKDMTVDNCTCMCHKDGFLGFIWQVLVFFYKLFGITKKQVCDCGVAHW